MQNLMKQIDHFSIQLNAYICKITGTLIFIQFGIVLYGVFFRYVLNNPLSWVLPISRIILVWTGLLGISIAFKEGEHVSMRNFVYHLPVKLRKVIFFADYILIMTYLFVLIWKGFPIAFHSTQLVMISEKIQIPLSISMMAVPVGALINLIYLLPIPLLVQRELEERKKIKE